MRPDEILAIVVSYNGGERIKESVEALSGQVGRVHIVDNGSCEESLAFLEELERRPNVTVQRLGDNRGVGHALNQGVKQAKGSSHSWLLTMDQDSIVDRGLVLAYQAAIERDQTRVCLAPVLRERDSFSLSPDKAIGYAITSGNLVRVDVFDRIGLYNEGFFIDCIDFDFCLRVRKAGYAIVRVGGAFMIHQLGEPVDIPKPFRKYYARHSPTRRYYMYRNFMYMVEIHFRRFPTFILKLGLAQLLLTFLIGFLDQRPIESYKAVSRGVKDYFARREGRLESCE